MLNEYIQENNFHMRIKISFLRVQDSTYSVPLHHQKLVSAFIENMIQEIGYRPQFYNFSSLKGTSKVQNGFMKFMSSKISLVVSSPDAKFIEDFAKILFSKQQVLIGKLGLTPKSYEMIQTPELPSVVKYVCISPLVLVDPDRDEMGALDSYDPSSQEFSDLLYDALFENLEKASFSEDELNSFAEFEAVPDADYIEKINSTGKKYARSYRNNNDKTMMGYLLPFTLHAHPTVHKFIWENGLGALNLQGYGMVDLVKD